MTATVLPASAVPLSTGVGSLVVSAATVGVAGAVVSMVTSCVWLVPPWLAALTTFRFSVEVLVRPLSA